MKLGFDNRICAIVIDDFDMSIANQRDGSDLLNTFLIHLCDNPISINGDTVNLVPIILTGNNFSSMYPPLLRHGRLVWQKTQSTLFKLPTRRTSLQRLRRAKSWHSAICRRFVGMARESVKRYNIIHTLKI